MFHVDGDPAFGFERDIVYGGTGYDTVIASEATSSRATPASRC